MKIALLFQFFLLDQIVLGVYDFCNNCRTLYLCKGACSFIFSKLFADDLGLFNRGLDADDEADDPDDAALLAALEQLDERSVDVSSDDDDDDGIEDDDERSLNDIWMEEKINS